ncbi:hypothetical protein AB0N88_30275 [Streptomyces sp. NPDC093516]|uniref:hypothetical protein n=1 Tax=Streptomyces sp. NPDC093516 TaxID=3155304 RepID=UPI003440998E
MTAVPYTSVYRATENTLLWAPIHAAAERAIATPGIPSIILCNTAYTELYVSVAMQSRGSGIIAAATGDGRIAAATRADFR